MEQRRDFDLYAQVGEWRRWQERTSSLSPRELDELEDHLRSHLDLEVELSPGLAPSRAFRVGCREIGTGAALSKEFAKVEVAGWRRVFMAGWAMYAVSFLLPVAVFGLDHGFELFLVLVLLDLGYPQVLAFVVLPNLAMLMTVPELLGRKLPTARCVKWLLGVAGVGAIGTAQVTLSLAVFDGRNGGPWDAVAGFGVGYWIWAASLTVVAAALHLRAREWASAKPTAPNKSPGRRVCQ